MLEKKRRMMGKPQDKPQERQLESNKKEVASSVTDSKSPTPRRISSPVKRASTKEEPKETSSDEYLADVEDAEEDVGVACPDVVRDVLNRVAMVNNNVCGYGADIRRDIKKLTDIVNRLASSINDSDNSSELKVEDLPEFGYCFYNADVGEWQLTFDEAVTKKSVSIYATARTRIMWEELIGDDDDDDDDDNNKKTYF